MDPYSIFHWSVRCDTTTLGRWSGAGILLNAHLNVITGVEGLQIELCVGLGSPETQVDGVVGAIPWDWVVVCHCRHLQHIDW